MRPPDRPTARPAASPPPHRERPTFGPSIHPWVVHLFGPGGGTLEGPRCRRSRHVAQVVRAGPEHRRDPDHPVVSEFLVIERAPATPIPRPVPPPPAAPFVTIV